MKKFVLLVLILLHGMCVFSQTREFPRIMYVNSREGLRFRLEPSISGARIGLALHGERIRLYDRSDTPDTVDGIISYWYRTDGKYIEGVWYSPVWIFGGYLSEQMPEDTPAILGYWDVEGKRNIYYYFRPDQTYSEGYKESDMGVGGTWTLTNNILTLIISGPLMDFDDAVRPEIQVVIDITVNSRDSIILNYPDGEKVHLLRNNGIF